MLLEGITPDCTQQWRMCIWSSSLWNCGCSSTTETPTWPATSWETSGLWKTSAWRYNLWFLEKQSKVQSDTLLTNKCCSQPTTDYQSWIYDDQIAGFYEQYGNITFLTVKVTISVLFSVCFFYMFALLWNTAVLSVSGCGSHGSSVGSRSSFSHVPVFHNKRILLSHNVIPALFTC